MFADPHPTRLEKLVEDPDVENHRKLFCGWYDHCLDQAVAGKWASWTCERCPLFGVKPPAPGALARDNPGPAVIRRLCAVEGAAPDAVALPSSLAG